MAVLEESLYTYLKNNAGVKALVSSRIYPGKKPQEAAVPCIVYHRISTERVLTHDTVGKSGSLGHPRFQFDVWGETFASVRSVQEALRDALQGRSATGFQVALVDDEYLNFDANAELFLGRSDFLFWHEE